MENKDCRLVHLPTKGKSRFHVFNNGSMCLLIDPSIEVNGIGERPKSAHHLYLTSNDQPIKGDWIATKAGVRKVTMTECQIATDCLEVNGYNAILKSSCRKVIAANDLKLHEDGIPLLHENDVEWYVKNQGSVSDITIPVFLCPIEPVGTQPHEYLPMVDDITKCIFINKPPIGILEMNTDISEDKMKEFREQWKEHMSTNPPPMMFTANIDCTQVHIGNWDEVFTILNNPDVSDGTKEAMIKERYHAPIKK